MQQSVRSLVLLMLLCSAFAAFAQTLPYTQMYVFGDSYSDSGAGYVDGNGPTAVVYLAQQLGIPFTYYGDPSTKTEHPIREGLNFASSGAKSGSAEGNRMPSGGAMGRGMKNQVDDFSALVRAGDVRFNPQTTMFFLMGGLNDSGLPAGATRANEEALIEQLYALGARRFTVALIPEKMPHFERAGERANAELPAVPADMRARHRDIQVTLSHWGPFYDEVITHPALYGFTNVTDFCAQRAFRGETPTPCATPETYFFYHPQHPSTAAHKVVGSLLYEEAISLY